METTGGNVSYINGKNEIHNRIIHNVVRSGILDSNQHNNNNNNNKWCCASET